MAAFIVPEEELVEDRQTTVLKSDPDSAWVRCMFGENRLAFRKIAGWKSESYDHFLRILDATASMEAMEEAELNDKAEPTNEDVKGLIERVKDQVSRVEDIKEFLAGISVKPQAEWLMQEYISLSETVGLLSVIMQAPETQEEIESVQKK